MRNINRLKLVVSLQSTLKQTNRQLGYSRALRSIATMQTLNAKN